MAKGYLYDNGDELITREDVNEVPDSSTAHAGDVLELDSNKKPKWSTPESELPDTTSASQGDVLSLDEDKEPVWSTPSGGGGGDLIVTIDWDNPGTPIEVSGKTYEPFPIVKNDGDPLSMSDVFDDGVLKNIPILLDIAQLNTTVYNLGVYQSVNVPGYTYVLLYEHSSDSYNLFAKESDNAFYLFQEQSN